VTFLKIGAARRLLVIVACVAVAAMMPTPSHAAAKIQHLISPGGIEAWFVQDATVPLVAMEFAMDGGAAQDPDGKAGVGNMVADLIDEGSGDLDSRAFHEHLDRRAIELSFSVTRDYFRGSLRMLKDNNKDEAFDLLRTSLSSPHFDSADVERIRAQLISGLKRETSNPNSLAGRKFLEIAYGDHPYGRPAGGTLESVPNITIADMKNYVGRVLSREHLKIAVVGDIDAASLGTLLDRTFGRLPAKSTLVPVPDIAASKPPQREFIALDVPQTVVTFGGPGIRRNDPDFMAAFVVNHILGGGSGSRLYREVREKRGLAYSISDSLVWMDHSSLFVGSTGTRADRAGETLDALTREIRRMAEGGPTEQELAEAKSYLKGSRMLSLDTSSKLASAMLQYQLDHLSIDYMERRNALVDAVTIDEAKQAARRLWGDGLLTVIVGRAPQAAAQPVAATPLKAN
jgi:zinc protease